MKKSKRQAPLFASGDYVSLTVSVQSWWAGLCGLAPTSIGTTFVVSGDHYFTHGGYILVSDGNEKRLYPVECLRRVA